MFAPRSMERPSRGTGAGARRYVVVALALLILLLAVGLVAPLSGQEAAGDTAVATLAGEAVLAGPGEPAQGAEIDLPDLGRTAVVDGEGSFRLEGLPPGIHRLEVRYLGRSSGPIELRLEPGARARVTVTVFQRVVRGEELRATVERSPARSARMRGFHRRRQRGIGTFLTSEEIRSVGGTRLADVFRGALGVRVRPCPGGHPSGDCFLLTSSRRRCSPTVFLDGARLGVGDGPVRLVDIPKEWIQAIEIYAGPSQVPDRYVSGSDCGTVLLWTRTGAEA